jgi:hypothetical protein
MMICFGELGFKGFWLFTIAVVNDISNHVKIAK